MVRVGAQEFHVLDLDRVHAGDLAGNARHRVGVARTVERFARVVDVDARQRRGETVGIAFAAHFAVGDDVEPGPFLVADRQDGGVVLGFFQVFRIDAPQLLGPRARREPPGQLGAVKQPVGLGVGADQRGRQQGVDGGHVGILPIMFCRP